MVQILGIPMYDKSLSTAVCLVEKTCLSNQDRTNRLICAASAHGLVTAQLNSELARILDAFSFILPDGMPSVWIGKLKGAKKMERCYGPDFFKEIMLSTAKAPIKHFFCGGKEGVAAALKKVCENKFSNFNITGVFSPPFRTMAEDELLALADQIRESDADIVWVGMSTPKQERFAYLLSKYINVHFIITVGAAFDFFTDRALQAPKFLQKAGLEWFFRLCTNPRRLAKRYFKIVPLFIYHNFKEWILN